MMGGESAVDTARYTARIGYSGPLAPTVAVLCDLHRRHMEAVPFENLDVPLGRRILLAPDALWDKVMIRRRGGFCYELNTLFGRMLQALGYPVDFLSARVWTGAGWGPDKDHMALLVHVGTEAWLADVGFGDSFVVPLRLVPDTVQEDGFKAYRLLEGGGSWVMQEQGPDGAWNHAYQFARQAHAPESFQEMCDYQQTSPHSTFTRRVVCSRATTLGRVTVTHNRLIVTTAGVREETPLPDAAAFGAALGAHHGIHLTPEEAGSIVARFSAGA